MGRRQRKSSSSLKAVGEKLHCESLSVAGYAQVLLPDIVPTQQPNVRALLWAVCFGGKVVSEQQLVIHEQWFRAELP